MNIEHFSYYEATINYHRTDDLLEDALPNHSHVHLQAVWVAEEGEKFEGDRMFSVAESFYTLPQRDLVDITESTREEYLKNRI